MLVAQILKVKGDLVFTVTPSDSISSVAALLHARRVGALVVVDAGKVVGIVSERDVVRSLAENGAPALERPVASCMTSDVLFARPVETVDALLERMTDRRVRHLPVCEGDKLLGIVSIGDLVKHKISEVVAEADGLKAYIAAG